MGTEERAVVGIEMLRRDLHSFSLFFFFPVGILWKDVDVSRDQYWGVIFIIIIHLT